MPHTPEAGHQSGKDKVIKTARMLAITAGVALAPPPAALAKGTARQAGSQPKLVRTAELEREADNAARKGVLPFLTGGIFIKRIVQTGGDAYSPTHTGGEKYQAAATYTVWQYLERPFVVSRIAGRRPQSQDNLWDGSFEFGYQDNSSKQPSIRLVKFDSATMLRVIYPAQPLVEYVSFSTDAHNDLDWDHPIVTTDGTPNKGEPVPFGPGEHVGRLHDTPQG